MFMRPGSVERWRVLNGSRGSGAVSALHGFERPVRVQGQRVRGAWRRGEGDAPARKLVLATRADLEAAKLPLYQLAFDGLTLVDLWRTGVPGTPSRICHAEMREARVRCNRVPAAGEKLDGGPASQLGSLLSRRSVVAERIRTAERSLDVDRESRRTVFQGATLMRRAKVFTVLAQGRDSAHRQLPGTPAAVGCWGARGSAGHDRQSGTLRRRVAHSAMCEARAVGSDFDVNVAARPSFRPFPPFCSRSRTMRTRMTAAEARIRNAPAGSHRHADGEYTGYGVRRASRLIEGPEASRRRTRNSQPAHAWVRVQRHARAAGPECTDDGHQQQLRFGEDIRIRRRPQEVLAEHPQIAFARR
jgi:hypothetical protein